MGNIPPLEVCRATKKEGTKKVAVDVNGMAVLLLWYGKKGRIECHLRTLVDAKGESVCVGSAACLLAARQCNILGERPRRTRKEHENSICWLVHSRVLDS